MFGIEADLHLDACSKNVECIVYNESFQVQLRTFEMFANDITESVADLVLGPLYSSCQIP